MKINALIYAPLMLLMPLLAHAGTVQIVQGTPGDNNELPATSPAPGFPNVINFANLEGQITSLSTAAQENCVNNGLQCPTFSSTQYASQGVTITSPDGLLIYPFSDQTAGGIELFDPGAGGGEWHRKHNRQSRRRRERSRDRPVGLRRPGGSHN